jgi:hypothetical protein
MSGDDDPSIETIDRGEDMNNEEHHVELNLSSLEWEIINQALNAPIRGHLVKGIREQGYTHEEHVIESTLEELAERWASTW